MRFPVSSAIAASISVALVLGGCLGSGGGGTCADAAAGGSVDREDPGSAPTTTAVGCGGASSASGGKTASSGGKPPDGEASGGRGGASPNPDGLCSGCEALTCPSGAVVDICHDPAPCTAAVRGTVSVVCDGSDCADAVDIACKPTDAGDDGSSGGAAGDDGGFGGDGSGDDGSSGGSASTCTPDTYSCAANADCCNGHCLGGNCTDHCGTRDDTATWAPEALTAGACCDGFEPSAFDQYGEAYCQPVGCGVPGAPCTTEASCCARLVCAETCG